MLNNNDPGPHICIVQSERLVSKCVMGAWFQFVDVGKKTFSTNSLLSEFFFPLEFFIFHSTNREAEDVQIERKGS